MNKYIGRFLLVATLAAAPALIKAQDNDPDKLGAPNVIRGGSSASKPPKLSKNEQKAADVKARQKKDADKAEKEGKKFHESIQSKQTKQMMKDSKKKADAWHDNKKKPWWKRIF